MIKAQSNLITLPKLKNILNKQSIKVLLQEEAHFEELEYEKLEIDLKANGNIKFGSLTVHGELGSNVDLNLIRILFSRLGPNVGSQGRLSVRFGFNEKESSQDDDGHDAIYFRKEYGKWYFDYSCSASKVGVDKIYGLATIKEMISLLSLPITVIEHDEFYELKHSENLGFRTSGGILGRSPDSFFCEIPDTDLESLTDKAQLFLSAFSTGQIYSVDWGAGYSAIVDGANPDSDKVLRLYNSTINQSIPAQKYTLWLSFELDDIDGLQALVPLCHSGNTITALYGIFSFPKENVGISIVVVEGGFKLELKAKSNKHFTEVSERLGIDFES